MKQVIQSRKTGKLRLLDVPEPIVAAGQLLVQTQSSLISVGTERSVINFAKKNLLGKAKDRPDLVKKVLKKFNKDGFKQTFQSVMSRLDEPLPLGYSASGKILALGDGLEGQFSIDQRVAIAGAGIANHSELNLVPSNLAVPIPKTVSFEEACFGTVSSIALHAVRNLNSALGDTIAVIGMGLIGQLAAQLLSLSGSRVIALDYNEQRLQLAKKLGAEFAVNLSSKNPSDIIQNLIMNKGCDGILIAAATKSNEPFQTAADIARDRATVCLVGMVGTEFPYAGFMKKELNIIISRSYGPGRYDHDFEQKGLKYPTGWVRWTETENLNECLRLMALEPQKKLNVTPLISHKIPFESAVEAYSMIMSNSEPHMGVVLSYPENKYKKRHLSINLLNKTKPSPCILGMVGAGNFAKSVLLPRLKANKDITLHTVVTRHGASADHNKKAFKFLNSSTDINAVMLNPEINTVIIATRHDSHASLATQALNSGKNVYVEKPIALNKTELNKVVRARNKSKNSFFQIGFNRRFAPMAIRVKTELEQLNEAKFMTFRINAGRLPQDHWVNRPDEGGGRLIGELCHFIDLARFFALSPIKSVFAEASGGRASLCENVITSLTFEDGSLANILYTAEGDESEGKEQYEIFSGGKNLRINDFRELKITGGKKSVSKKSAQDKGFDEALKSFIQAVKEPSKTPINEEEMIQSTFATLCVLESIKNGKRIIF